jgi:hypothetical protein
VKRLRELGAGHRPDLSAFGRRGFARQREQRCREHTVRSHVVELAHWTMGQGWNCATIAESLHLSPRTLRQWQADVGHQRLGVQPLGRPTCRSPRKERNEVIAFIDAWGPGIGVPTLREAFPELPRAEMEDLLKRYRRIWRRRHYQALRVLHWQVPGLVWAMDFAEAPAAIDGLYEYLLAVRDLASGQQLLWQPIRSATAEEAGVALAALFARYGIPLVLKTDNGSPFGAEDTQGLLHQATVIPLFSPPRTPRYNGAVEAGIGSLKARTECHAARHGRPAQWTWDDVEAGRLEANATARPQGPTGPTPDEIWTSRRKITADERTCFHATVERRRAEVRLEKKYPAEGPLSVRDDRAVDRLAIQRALVEHGYLLFSRRRIPLPFTRKKAANIS